MIVEEKNVIAVIDAVVKVYQSGGRVSVPNKYEGFKVKVLIMEKKK